MHRRRRARPPSDAATRPRAVVVKVAATRPTTVAATATATVLAPPLGRMAWASLLCLANSLNAARTTTAVPRAPARVQTGGRDAGKGEAADARARICAYLLHTRIHTIQHLSRVCRAEAGSAEPPVASSAPGEREAPASAAAATTAVRSSGRAADAQRAALARSGAAPSQGELVSIVSGRHVLPLPSQQAQESPPQQQQPPPRTAKQRQSLKQQRTRAQRPGGDGAAPSFADALSPSSRETEPSPQSTGEDDQIAAAAAAAAAMPPPPGAKETDWTEHARHPTLVDRTADSYCSRVCVCMLVHVYMFAASVCVCGWVCLGGCLCVY